MPPVVPPFLIGLIAASLVKRLGKPLMQGIVKTSVGLGIEAKRAVHVASVGIQDLAAEATAEMLAAQMTHGAEHGTDTGAPEGGTAGRTGAGTGSAPAAAAAHAAQAGEREQGRRQGPRRRFGGCHGALSLLTGFSRCPRRARYHGPTQALGTSPRRTFVCARRRGFQFPAGYARPFLDAPL